MAVLIRHTAVGSAGPRIQPAPIIGPCTLKATSGRRYCFARGRCAALFRLAGRSAGFQHFAHRLPEPRNLRRLAFTGLTVVIFLFLLVLLLLLRAILKLYADQSSSALGARLRTRMVLGAVSLRWMPAVFMFLFSFQLMNRPSIAGFPPNTSQLREDSTRVVLELAQYVGEQRPQ